MAGIGVHLFWIIALRSIAGRYRTCAGNLGRIRVKLALRLRYRRAGLALFAWFIFPNRSGCDPARFRHARLVGSSYSTALRTRLSSLILLDGVCASAAPLPKSISFGTLFRIRWAGESLSNVVPSAYLGGEARKSICSINAACRVVDGASSVIIGKTACQSPG